ncbi:MAG TPA: hypothetical protein VFM68_00470 [Candidatus Saccharimonadales bacterium]|nr:hypothetical protein [Candidatus Saccharimonadales bacterium]
MTEIIARHKFDDQLAEQNNALAVGEGVQLTSHVDNDNAAMEGLETFGAKLVQLRQESASDGVVERQKKQIELLKKDVTARLTAVTQKVEAAVKAQAELKTEFASDLEKLTNLNDDFEDVLVDETTAESEYVDLMKHSFDLRVRLGRLKTEIAGLRSQENEWKSRLDTAIEYRQQLDQRQMAAIKAIGAAALAVQIMNDVPALGTIPKDLTGPLANEVIINDTNMNYVSQFDNENGLVGPTDTVTIVIPHYSPAEADDEQKIDDEPIPEEILLPAQLSPKKATKRRFKQ